MRKTCRLLIAAGAVLLLAAKASAGNRLMRNTPVEQKTTVSFDSGNVNLWPLYFRSGAYSSALWPMIDSDPSGFAVRPFFSKEKNEYSVLWPLSEWNTQNGRFHVVPFYWSGTRDYGLVPLYFRNMDFHLFSLLAWYSDTSFGIYPVLCIDRKDRLSWAGPFWMDPSDKSGGILPLLKLGGSGVRWCGPAYWNPEDGNRGFLPLADYTPGKSSWILLWWRNEKGSSQGVFPFVWLTPELNAAGPVLWNRKSDLSAVLPLYFRSKTFQCFGPVWRNAVTGAKGVFPFAHFSDGVNFCGPVFWDKRKDLFTVLPVFGRSPKVEWCLPLYLLDKTGDRKTLLSPLGMAEYNDSGLRTLDILGPVYFRSREKEMESILFPLFIRSLDGEGFSLFPLVSWKSRILSPVFNWTDGKNFNLLCWSIYGVRTRGSRGKQPSAEKIIPEETYSRVMGNLFFQRSEREWITADGNREECEKTRLLFGLLFSGEKRQETEKYSVLRGVVRGESEPGKASSRVLEFLYRSQRDGNEEKTVFFPFVTIQRAPGKYSFGIVHDRFLGTRVIDGKRSVRIFGIPF